MSAPVLPASPQPSWRPPVVAGVVSLVVGAADRHAIDAASTQLRNPLLFLLAAVPLTELLGALGLFRSLAALVDGGHPLPLVLWDPGRARPALLNLDTSVVLLTPLAVELARARSMDEGTLAFGPVLLASLASSPLPVSNLTNLIGAENWHFGAAQFATHLGLPTIVAVVVAWPLMARVLPTRLAEPPMQRRTLARCASASKSSVHSPSGSRSTTPLAHRSRTDL